MLCCRHQMLSAHLSLTFPADLHPSRPPPFSAQKMVWSLQDPDPHTEVFLATPSLNASQVPLSAGCQVAGVRSGGWREAGGWEAGPDIQSPSARIGESELFLLATPTSHSPFPPQWGTGPWR